MRYLVVAEAYRDMEQVSSRLALTEWLAALLAQTPAGLLPAVCYLCQGLIAPEFAGVDLGLAEKLAVRTVAAVAGTDASAFRWRLETRESYECRPPRLVALDELAGPRQAPRWQVLRAVAEQGVAAPLSRQKLLAERDRILAERPGDFTAFAAALKVGVSSIDQPALADAVRDGFEALSALADQHGSRLFPQLAVRFVRFSPVLTRRLALARMLMHVEEEPALLQRRPTPPPGATAFGSGWHLASDLALTRDAYFAPLFLSASPWVWSVVCPRLPGLIVYDLGTPVVGRRGEASELLQVFFPPGRLASGVGPPVSGAHTAAATAWWIRQLNILLSELTDFSTYQDAEGAFVARRLFEVLMSVDDAVFDYMILGELRNASRRVLAKALGWPG